VTKFNYVSLFSGIGGFEQALNKLGGHCVMASEIDKFAEQAYQTLYGHATVGDITKVKAEEVPDHDVLVAGIPCQAFSVAGKRGGFNEARGTLFFDVARIAKEKQPKAVWIENVKGLISHDSGRTLDTIVKTLNECGYRVDFNVLNSKYFGVAQNRERIFLVGIREDLVGNEPWRIDAKDKTIVPKGKRRISGYGDVKTFNFDWPAQEEVTTRLRDILEPGVDEKYYLLEEKTAALVAQLDEGLAVKEASGVNHGVVEPKMVGHVDIKGHDAIKRVYSAEGVSPTVTTMGGGHREPKIAEEVRPVLTPDRLNKQQNGRRFKGDGEESFTLTSQDRHGVALSAKSIGNTNPSGKGMNGEVYDIDAGLSPTLTTNKGEGSRIASAPTYRIRKLTPRECFRLQSFPDSAHQALVDAGISNSQLYKQVGNAVTVNVIEAIGAKLQRYL